MRSLHEEFVTSKRGIKRGGEFIECEEQSDVQPVNKTHWVAQQRKDAYELTTRYHSPAERGMEPIWGLAARVLRWERLRRTRFETQVLDALGEFGLWKEQVISYFIRVLALQ